MSTYRMDNIKEMVNYCKDTKSITIGKPYKNYIDQKLFEVALFSSDTPSYETCEDSVYCSKATLKAFLRRFTGLSKDELDNQLYRLTKSYGDKISDIWNTKVIIKEGLLHLAE